MEDRPITKTFLQELLRSLPTRQWEIDDRPELRFPIPAQVSVFPKENAPMKATKFDVVIARYEYSLDDWILIFPQ